MRRTALLAAAALFAASASLSAQVPTPVLLPVGGSAAVHVDVTLRRVYLASSEIAEATPLSAHDVIVRGKSVGSTVLTLVGTKGEVSHWPVEVSVDVAAVERAIRATHPAEPILVTSAGNTIILSGRVKDPTAAADARTLAAATGAKVLDRIEVPAPRQILLHVRIAEVNRSVINQFTARALQLTNGAVQGVGGAGSVTSVLDEKGLRTAFSDAVNLFLMKPSIDLALMMNALRSQGALRSLAEPNLLAAEGAEASFLAGGEFPIPLVSQNGMSVEYKEYGVRLKFKGTITPMGTIRLNVSPEASALDFGNAVVTNNIRIPAVTTRRASTEFELASGQSFAIAGLLDNSSSSNIDKVPFLGSIPVLGQLFRSKDFRQKRTELLVVVTPELVTPTSAAVTVPTGEPNTWPWDKALRDTTNTSKRRP